MLYEHTEQYLKTVLVGKHFCLCVLICGPYVPKLKQITVLGDIEKSWQTASQRLKAAFVPPVTVINCCPPPATLIG